MAKVDYKVCVTCNTYNHVSYIEDALNGFCMQETDFPFVCTIIDDASTDGEPEIIQKYLQNHFDLEDKSIVRNEETDDYILIFSRHKTNLNCYFVVLFLKYNHYRIRKDKRFYVSEWQKNVIYQATCEGDDYWIDPYKLQKQVSFLDAHPDYVFCCHETKRYRQETGEMFVKKREIFDKYPDGFSFESYEDGLKSAQTLTNVFRSDYKDKDIYLSMKNRYDVIFYFFITQAGKCFLMPDVMSVYRIHKGGICSGASFDTFYLNILYAFHELNQKVKSYEARRVLCRHFRVNVCHMILLRRWDLIVQSMKIIKKHAYFYEYLFFIIILPIYGCYQVFRILWDVFRYKIKKIF